MPYQIKIRSRGPATVLLGCVATVSLAAGGYVVYLTTTTTTNYGFAEILGWTFGPLFLLEGFVAAAFVPATLRPLVWTPQGLRVPKGFKTTTIPIDEIAGLGLLYRKAQVGTRTPSRWSAYAFKEDGSAVQLGGAIYAPSRFVKAGDPSRTPRRLLVKGTEDERASTDSSALRDSIPGQLIEHLQDLVLTAQGTNGKLATMQMQKHSHWSAWGNVTSFWSPDGEMGPVAKDGSRY